MRYPSNAGRMLTVLAVMALLGATLTGCPTPEPEETLVPPLGPDGVEPAEVPPPEDRHEDAIQVTLLDGAIEMPDSVFAGAVSFEVSNEGTRVHNFQIEGQGFEWSLENNLMPGESETMHIDLQPGEYEVYCPVGDHAGEGERRTLEAVLIE